MQASAAHIDFNHAESAFSSPVLKMLIRTIQLYRYDMLILGMRSSSLDDRDNEEVDCEVL